MISLDSMEGLFTWLEKKLKDDPSLFLLIDGPCGSGKTCLAQALEKAFDCALFHMDDYLLPFSLRTPQRMAQLGGHVHFERIVEDICQPFSQGAGTVVHPYRCHLQDFLSPIAVDYRPFYILEGSFSHHPAIQGSGALKLYLMCPREVQLCRLQAREGEEKLQAFIHQWIPREDAYFKGFSIEETCDLHLNTGNLFP